ncbi:MAG TPA: riboflavin synthase [Ferruginibacter sp.]|nr:riboflavin synthase [Ferruginibacter sp.]
MFTGIIEKTGVIEEVLSNGTNRTFLVSSPLYNELKVDQSLSHDGVCLTIETLKDGFHQVTAIAETLHKTNLGTWQKGSIVNLERCMQLNGRLDGHFVQGHVDTTAKCLDVVNQNGSWEYRFGFDKSFSSLIIEKGSVTVNGISLTCFNVTRDQFTVAIVPYTYQHTNISRIKTGDTVNIEWDMVGKYVNRLINLNR